MTESRAMLQVPSLPPLGSTPPFNPFPNGQPPDLAKLRDKIMRQGGEKPAPTTGGILDTLKDVFMKPVPGGLIDQVAQGQVGVPNLLGVDYPQLKADAAKTGKDIAVYAGFILIFAIAVYVFLKAGD